MNISEFPLMHCVMNHTVLETNTRQFLHTTELLKLMYPGRRLEAEAAFLLGTYMELVEAKKKELMVGTVRGVLQAKVFLILL